MREIAPTDELLNRVFQLAYFIIGERTAAIYLSMAALDKLKIASAAQGRRQEYVPTGRYSYPAARTRVSLSRLHLLQRLVYAESEPFEKLTEVREALPRQQDMVVRFVKHLVMVTTRRNSFYVSLGLCRLLHNYTTTETAEIYNLLLQDPDRARDDDYYRSRKKHLLREMKGRFGDALRTYRGQRGEERFQPQDDSGPYAALVRECLSRFTPWDSACVLPAGIDPAREIAAPLLFTGGDPDQEHGIEVNRIHTLLHPDCLGRLAETLGLDSPSLRLEIPRFFAGGHDGDSWHDRLNPRPLNEGELRVMRGHFERNAAARLEASKRVLAILIDGAERSRFEVAGAGGGSVRAPAGASWAEVRSVEAEGSVTLALHPLPFSATAAVAAPAGVVRGEGHELLFSAGPDGDSPGLVVGVRYRETGAAGLLSSLARRLGALRSGVSGFGHQAGFDRLRGALGSVLLAVGLIAGLLIYIRSGKIPPGVPAPPAQEQVARQGGPGERPPAPTASVTPHGLPESPPAGGAGGLRKGGVRPERPRRQGRPEDTARAATAPPAAGSDPARFPETTRGRTPRLPSTALLEVRRVYVDPLVGGAAGQQVREALTKSLQSSGRFTTAPTRGEAEAVFQGAVVRERRRRGELVVVLRLVNAKGQVVWPSAAGGYRKTYSGPPPEMTDRLVNDLLADIQRLGGRQ